MNISEDSGAAKNHKFDLHHCESLKSHINDLLMQ